MLSMTGYGRGHASQAGRELLLELKTVNHRFLDVSLRLPRPITFLEEPLRTRISEGSLQRGHVDVSVTYANLRPDAQSVTIDSALLAQCSQAADAVALQLDRETPDLASLLTLCGALHVTQAEEDAEAVTVLMQTACDEALAQLQAMRQREGEALARDMQANLRQCEALTTEVEQRAPAVPEAYRQRLEARLVEWAVQAADPQRVAQEVALMADRCAIDEELARLRSHYAQFAQCLQDPGEVGRRMDFLLQEMNREANTIGSKASDAPIAQRVVELKCLLEKLREQAQNVV